MWRLGLLRESEFREDIRVAAIGFFILTPIAVGIYVFAAPASAALSNKNRR
jgi:hypothetical protein